LDPFGGGNGKQHIFMMFEKIIVQQMELSELKKQSDVQPVIIQPTTA
jgi:hypothetical protein